MTQGLVEYMIFIPMFIAWIFFMLPFWAEKKIQWAPILFLLFGIGTGYGICYTILEHEKNFLFLFAIIGMSFLKTKGQLEMNR